MQSIKSPDKNEILSLPVSVKSYVIIRDYIMYHAEYEVYQKLIEEYLEELPLFELLQILYLGRLMLGKDYQRIVGRIFVH